MRMSASAKRFNLIKVITLIVVMGFIVFSMLAGRADFWGAFF
jgi:hypothetical protein